MVNKIKKYNKILYQWLSNYVKERSEENDEYVLIADKENFHYQVVRMLWEKGVFKHVVIFHLQIKNTGRIWIYVNRTDIPIDEEFDELGIPASDLVIAFLPTEMRLHSKYAVN